MVFLNDNEYTPLNIHNRWPLLSDKYTNLFLEISIMSDQVEIHDDSVDMHIRVYDETNNKVNVVYDWNLPTTARWLRDITYDISMRLMDTAQYGIPYCLERFMGKYFIFSLFDEETGEYRFQSVHTEEDGELLVTNDKPKQLLDLLNEAPSLQSYIRMTRTQFKNLASFSSVIAKECNRYYYLIVHVLPEVINPPKPKPKKKAVKKK